VKVVKREKRLWRRDGFVRLGDRHLDRQCHLGPRHSREWKRRWKKAWSEKEGLKPKNGDRGGGGEMRGVVKKRRVVFARLDLEKKKKGID
jgi:hypothetical protein